MRPVPSPVLFTSVLCAGLVFAVGAGAQNPQTNLNGLPKWSEFPAPPTGVPTAAEIKARVDVQTALQKTLEAEVAALVWDVQEPDQLAAAARKNLNPDQMAPVDKAMTPAEVDAMAADLRARAAPPPIAN